MEQKSSSPLVLDFVGAGPFPRGKAIADELEAICSDFPELAPFSRYRTTIEALRIQSSPAESERSNTFPHTKIEASSPVYAALDPVARHGGERNDLQFSIERFIRALLVADLTKGEEHRELSSNQRLELSRATRLLRNVDNASIEKLYTEVGDLIASRDLVGLAKVLGESATLGIKGFSARAENLKPLAHVFKKRKIRPPSPDSWVFNPTEQPAAPSIDYIDGLGGADPGQNLPVSGGLYTGPEESEEDKDCSPSKRRAFMKHGRQMRFTRQWGISPSDALLAEETNLALDYLLKLSPEDSFLAFARDTWILCGLTMRRWDDLAQALLPDEFRIDSVNPCILVVSNDKAALKYPVINRDNFAKF